MTWSAVAPSSVDDPFVRYAARPDSLAVAGPRGWAVLVQWRPHGHWGGLAVVDAGAPPEAESSAFAALFTMARERGIAPEWFSTASGRELVVPEHLRITGSGHWDFLWTDRPVAGEIDGADDLALIELDDAADKDRITQFGTTHNGSFEGFPGIGYASLWLGLTDRTGELLAIGGIHRLSSGAPHLAGIVVHQEHRGRRLGELITGELTTRAITEHGYSTLGVYSSNAAAIRLYHRLGYRTAHHIHTRSLAPTG